MSTFQTHVIVDWSARSRPSPKKPSKDAIWWAVVRDGQLQDPFYPRTRHDAIERLANLLAQEQDAGRRVLIGFDFPFGYPAGVAKHLTGKACALAIWSWLACRIEDGENNANNRFAVASEVNRLYPGLGPFWGRPAHWDYPDVPTKKKVRSCRGEHPPEQRLADCRANAKTVWQLAYAGSVGSQTLLGLPALKRLIEYPCMDEHRAKVEVWPFDTGLREPTASVVIAEIYPSLLKKTIDAKQRKGEIPDQAQVRVNAMAFAALDAKGELPRLFCGAPGFTDRQRKLVETEEGWILGLGHEHLLGGALD